MDNVAAFGVASREFESHHARWECSIVGNTAVSKTAILRSIRSIPIWKNVGYAKELSSAMKEGFQSLDQLRIT